LNARKTLYTFTRELSVDWPTLARISVLFFFPLHAPTKERRRANHKNASLSLSLRRPRDFRVVLLIFFSHCSVVMMHSLNNCLGASGRDTNKWNHAPTNNQRAPAELYSKRFPTDSQVRRPPCSPIE
jgi:hypothetical protein